jgi:hypothetical protein
MAIEEFERYDRNFAQARGGVPGIRPVEEAP